MSLYTIIWNDLYRTHPFKRASAALRIRAHYERMKLEKVGVTVANVRYVLIRSTRPHYLTTCSPTGWHGESGAATHGGHLTVRFKKADGSHFKTQHVYPTDEAYKRG